MLVTQLITAIQEAGAQNVIVFPNGRFQFVTTHGTFSFDTIADLERAFSPALGSNPTAATQ